MRRREFIAGGSAALLIPFAASAQQTGSIRRIGVLATNSAERALPFVTAFVQGLQELGWTVGRNLHIDYRFDVNIADAAAARRSAIEMVALKPDVILAQTGVVVGQLQQVTRTVPIVFVNAIDPVGAGLVTSRASGRQRYRFCSL